MSRTALVLLSASSLLTLSGATAASAQDRPIQLAAMLEGVTVTATRTETKLEDAPATVSVITAKDIEDDLVQDAKDLVRFEPGVAVRSSPPRFTAAGSSAGRDGNSGFNIRGLEGNRVLIQTDGIRMPDAYSFGAQSVGRGDYVDLDILKVVEIVRGPSSALYGSDGLAGAVSFITKEPDDLLGRGDQLSLRLKAGYASADKTWAEGLTAAGRQGDWSALVAYTRRDGEGRDTQGTNASANTDRTVPNPEDNASNALLAKLVYQPSDHQRLRLTFDHLDRDVDWIVLSAIAKPPLLSTSAIGLTAFDEMRRNRVSLDYRFDADSGLFRGGEGAVYYQDSHTRQFSAEDRFTAADRTRDATFDNRVVGASGQLESRLDTGRLQHLFVYGIDASRTRQEGVRDGTVPPAGETFPTRAFPTTDYTLAGVFVQDEITALGGKLVLYPAVRYDYYEIDPKADALFTANAPAGQSDSHLTPKLGVVVKAAEELTLFANVAMGFKAPSPSQVNNGFTNPVSNYRSISNPELKPETSRTGEVGARYKAERWSVSGTVFTGAYKDFIDQVQVGGNFTPANPAVYQYINLGSVEISGAEARASGHLGHGFTANLAASYSRGTSKLRGVKSPLDSIEPWKLVGGLGYHAADDRWGAQLTAVHSAGKARSRIGAACAPSCFAPGAFTVLDLTGHVNVTDKVTLRAGVFNLTDETYWWWSDARGLSSTSTVLDAYSQPGRNASVSLAVKF